MVMKPISQSILASLAGLGLIVAANTAEAANCTIDNWSSAVELTNANAGTQGANNRRYAGPCGLRVPVSSTLRYLQDDTPAAETSFNVRFYFFLNDVTGDVTLFQAAASNNDPVITATYVESTSVINVDIANNAATQTLIAEGVDVASWNSLEIQWKADGEETAKVILVNADLTDEVIGSAVNTSELRIDRARLGVLSVSAGASGSIDFDDYDSRRESVPGRLCRGLTDPDRAVGNSGFQELKFADIDNIFAEIASRGASPSAGVPDFDQDGQVKFSDLDAVFQRIASRQVSCAVNS